MRYAVINAGGGGTRLWPLSRATRPKQLLSVHGGKSLLRLAYERLVGLVPTERIYVCTGNAYIDAVAEHLPELPADNLLGEPAARDTANAFGFASAVLGARDPEAVLAFVTADHVIEPVPAFQDALRLGFETVEADPQAVVTFGIPPTSPHTGLGYVERGTQLPDTADVYAVSAFKEKPDLETAEKYVESGRYLWNSGMFVWRADTMLGELRQHLPESYEGMRAIATAWDTPSRDEVVTSTYERLRKISIDYAVMEPAARGEGAAHVRVVPMSVDWLDVGSWPTLARTLESDQAQNACNAITAMIDSEGNIVVSDDPDHLVATVGLHDTIIVHTHDVTMVCPKNAAERVRDLAARVQHTHGQRYA